MTAAVVVTGAASGIGRAVAERFLAEGRRVVGLDRDRAGLDALAGHPEQSALLKLEVDIAQGHEVSDALALAESEFGRIEVVVGAAGIWTPGTVTELTDEHWDRALAVNLTGMFNTARAAVRHFEAHGGGVFLAVASDVGVQGSQGCSAYVAAKHGVLGLVRSIALDYGATGVRANTICPGFVDTPMTEEIFRSAGPDLVAARRNEVPLGRFATPADVAAVVAAFASPGFGYVNGATFLVDGGSTAGYYTPRGDK